jgi:hypothetical protein
MCIIKTLAATTAEVEGEGLNESLTLHSQTLREVQDRKAWAQALRDLRKPQAQAATRIG